MGSYVPARILTNADLEKMVDTSDEWITTRTGIKERRHRRQGRVHLRPGARRPPCARCISAGVTADQIDLIIVATITPDMPFPSTACLVQRKIGAHRAAAFDLEAACSGFIYGARNRRSSSSCPAPTTPCWSSARRSSPPSSIGRTATPACSLATARARRFCRTAPTRMAC